MGNCSQSESPDQSISINLDHFEKVCAIGKGAYGKVWRVRHKPSGRSFAMKEMSKSMIVVKNAANSIMNERRLLGLLRHPFIVNLYYAFQNEKGLYLVIDLMNGGDFRYFLIKNQEIPEESLKFLTACIVAGLEYLHSNQIIHRDLKPENLVLDEYGYVHLTDFGIAKNNDGDNSGTSSGTPGYMSPEAICGQMYSTVSDYFALGVILFEITTGNRPYLGSTRKEIRDKILAKQVKYPSDAKVSKELKDFVNRLIQRKPESRLGAKGIHELKEHEWLKGMDWENLYAKQLKSPFKITHDDNFDKHQVNQKFIKIAQKPGEINQKLFSGYFFDHSKFVHIK